MKYAITLLLLSICFHHAQAQSEGFIDQSGRRIHYRTYGQGDPILIINGGPGMNSDGFVGLAKALSKNNLTIIYDQRGTGLSTITKTDTATITMKGMVDDLEALRKQLDIHQWIVLGHSFGGMLACYYATKFPENIEALILSSSGGIDLELQSYVGRVINNKLSSGELDSLAYWNKQISNGDTSYHAKYQRGLSLAPAYVYNRKFVQVIAERLTQSNMTINNLVWQDLQKIKFDCRKQLHTFGKPVLIIQGKQDIIELKTAQKAQEVLSQSKLVLMDRCVHYGWLDRPDIYFPEIEQFISSLKK